MDSRNPCVEAGERGVPLVIPRVVPARVELQMIRRRDFRYVPHQDPASQTTKEIEQRGFAVARGVFSPEEVAALRADIDDVFARVPPDMRSGRTSLSNASMFRYEMVNRSAGSQDVAGDPRILGLIEPLLGEDCHVIACTAWRNPPDVDHAPRGQEWHVDAGPFVPRAPGTEWPEHISYPVFVIAAHVFLQDCTLQDGPTAVVPGSHRSGCVPPDECVWEEELSYCDQVSEPMLARVGDVGFFVSDAWHRRLPPRERNRGRFFLQINYGRRDIAQRLLPTSEVNHASVAAIGRATTERGRRLIGLHPDVLYDG